jgi:TolB-like protein/DNA-binding winged helix-turn-helix (wHTH) protein
MDKSGTSHIARALRGNPSGPQPSLARGFRLADWRVRPDLCTLEKDGRSVQLEAKIMGVLLCLAEHAPHAVTREQFIEGVWNGRIVTDEVLSRAVSLLRAQLDDDVQQQRIIRTIPRVGYALNAAVLALEAAASPTAEASAEEQSEAPTTTWKLSRRRLTLTLVTVAMAAVAGLTWWTVTPDVAITGEIRLAVLPLAGLGAAAEESYVAAGLTEELIVSLSRVKGLRVVARDSSLRFKSGEADLPEVARALGATHVVSGSVRANYNRLRVTVHLSDSGSGTELWAETYDRAQGDLFAIQAEIATAVARALRQQLPAATADGSTRAAAIDQPPANPEAYRLFLQGRQQLARRGEEGTRAAIALLEKSIAADRTFVRAHLALAWACALLVNAAPAEAAVILDRADRALNEVARQTAMSGEVHAVRAWLEMERNHWQAAEEEFRAALAENPDDTELRLLYSQLLGATGQREAAWQEAREALASDPLSPAVNLRLAALSLWEDRDREAARYLGTARELGLAPSAAPELTLLMLIRERRFESLEQVLGDVQRRRGQSGDWVPIVVSAIRDPAHGPAAGIALERAAAANQLDRSLYLGALVLANQNERALRLLRSHQTLRSRELEFLLSNEATGLRRLAGFDQVVTRFGLDDYWDLAGWPTHCARVEAIIRCR